MARIAGFVFVIAAALSLQGPPAHSADLPSGTNGGIQALHFRPNLLTSTGARVALDDTRVVSQSRRVYEFRLRPGTFGIGGEYSHLTLQALTLDGEGFRPDVASWMQQATTRLVPIARSMVRPGLRVSPEETRVGQIVAKVLRPSMSRINIPPRLGSADFFVDQKGRVVWLTLFDRPCRIHGTWESGKHSYVADVEVPQAGLHALIVVDDDIGRHRIVLGPADLGTLNVVTVLDI